MIEFRNVATCLVVTLALPVGAFSQPSVPEIVVRPPNPPPIDVIVPIDPVPVPTPSISKAARQGRTWVVPHFAFERTPRDDGRPTLQFPPYRVELRFVNPGNESRSVSCIWFDRNGSMRLEESSSVTVGRGAQGSCSLSRSINAQGWVLIDADGPILPTASLIFDDEQGGTRANALNAHSIDCLKPTGFEYACQFSSATDGLPR